ncbi:hypothetical protein GRF29_1g2028325 [Pseudopithomyces chartarum]|uniref:Uncharacterized protein n=1 Tax=Pseudopithomyces chartarum TaxID=1892770 RepID=A0AAN6RLT9_9PLEO|nr:hypothetical protein GRF29_1g2028325 [Pseudopithomyces chartarum]
MFSAGTPKCNAVCNPFIPTPPNPSITIVSFALGAPVYRTAWYAVSTASALTAASSIVNPPGILATASCFTTAYSAKNPSDSPSP